MSANAISALFYPFESGHIDGPGVNANTLFINAEYHPDLAKFSGNGLVLQQYNKALCDALAAQGYRRAGPAFPDQGLFDVVLVHSPKQEAEARAMIAQAAAFLSPNGVLIVAAANNAGGGRLAKTLAQVSVSADKVEKLSKHKCTIAILRGADLVRDRELLEDWRGGGMLQTCATGYVSCPGIYGWDKIDRGSALLCSNLPGDFKGRGADLGCGYGYLSLFLLRNSMAPERLYCLDADYRAIQACQANIDEAGFSGRADCRWEDVLHLGADISGLDWVVMNPPFHAGKETMVALGSGFIFAAAKMLRPKGKLWMVSNAHLPYEEELKKVFSRHEKIFEGQGFKLFCAER